MKRFTRGVHSRGEIEEPPRVVAFMADLRAVFEKHGLILGHEDKHGGFIIEVLDEDGWEWVEVAALGHGVYGKEEDNA